MTVKLFCLYMIHDCALKSSGQNIYGITFLRLCLMMFCYGKRMLNSPTQKLVWFDVLFHYLGITILMPQISTSLDETPEAGTLWNHLHVFHMIKNRFFKCWSCDVNSHYSVDFVTWRYWFSFEILCCNCSYIQIKKRPRLMVIPGKEKEINMKRFLK